MLKVIRRPGESMEEALKRIAGEGLFPDAIEEYKINIFSGMDEETAALEILTGLDCDDDEVVDD